MILPKSGLFTSRYQFSEPLEGFQNKAVISLTQFSNLLVHMKRAEDNEVDSFGITDTMKGKTQLNSSLSVSGNTLHSGNPHTHTHFNTLYFP